MKYYEVNPDTLAVIGISDTQSRVLEGKNEYIVDKSAYEIMDDSCRYYGSSYQGRVEGTKKILDAHYKLPIVVEESNKIIFFPIVATDLSKCCWISLHNYQKSLSNYEKKRTEILFKNGKILHTRVSCYVIDHQILRASRLESILNSRTLY